MEPEFSENRDRAMQLFARTMSYLRPILLAIVLIALIYLIYRVGPGKLLEIALRLSPAWVAAALFFWAVNVSLTSLRYRSLAAPELNYLQVLEVVIAAYLLNYVAMVQGAGVGAKVGLMKGRRVPASRSLAGVGGEVILDLIFTGLVALIFTWYVGWGRSGMEKVNPLVWLLTVIAIVSGGVLMLIFSRFTKFGARLLEALRLAFSRQRLPVNIISTVGIWVMAAASFYCMLRAAGAVPPPPLTLAAISVGFLAGFISLVPGGLGVRDLTWAFVITSMTQIPITVTATAAFAHRILGIAFMAIALGIWTLLKRSDD